MDGGNDFAAGTSLHGAGIFNLLVMDVGMPSPTGTLAA